MKYFKYTLYNGSHTTKLYARNYTLYVITALSGGFLVE